jgi:hypothetical protein
MCLSYYMGSWRGRARHHRSIPSLQKNWPAGFGLGRLILASLCRKGMHGEPPDLDGQLVDPQPTIDIRGKVAHTNERLLEVQGWKYVGFILQVSKLI